MGSRTGKLIAKAFDRVEARRRVTGHTGNPVFSDELLREVAIEACVLLDRQIARNHRRIRKAAEKIGADAALIAAMSQPPFSPAQDWPAGRPPDGKGLPAERSGRRPPGPPPWHPEHLHSDN